MQPPLSGKARRNRRFFSDPRLNDMLPAHDVWGWLGWVRRSLGTLTEERRFAGLSPALLAAPVMSPASVFQL